MRYYWYLLIFHRHACLGQPFLVNPNRFFGIRRRMPTETCALGFASCRQSTRAPCFFWLSKRQSRLRWADTTLHNATSCYIIATHTQKGRSLIQTREWWNADRLWVVDFHFYLVNSTFSDARCHHDLRGERALQVFHGWNVMPNWRSPTSMQQNSRSISRPTKPLSKT